MPVDYEEYFAKPFIPTDGLEPELRQAKALEYIAHHLGEMNEKMDKLIETVFQVNR